MTAQLERPGTPPLDRPSGPARRGPTRRDVELRRLVTAVLVVGPLAWALSRSVPDGGEVVNRGGLRLLVDLLGSALQPALSQDFLARVGGAAVTTVVFALLGTAAALVLGVLGGLVLSDVVWDARPPALVRAVRVVLRGVLVLARSVHELIWALLLVSVLGLDPLVAVLAIALPFGAQTAKVFAETLDGVPGGPLAALRRSGARPGSAVVYGLLPAAAPLLISYAFYRFECAIRSAVLLGVVGVGGLGQELVVSLQSRNWDEVWTLVGAVLLLSALVDLWSGRVRAELAVVSSSDWSAGHGRSADGARPARGLRWGRWSGLLLLPALVVAWVVSGVGLSGIASPRTRDLAVRLLGDLWPPQLPRGGWPVVAGAVLDTLAMALLAMAVAVALTLLVAPWAARVRPVPADAGARRLGRWPRRLGWAVARLLLLVLRSVPPTVWAVLALLALFPGVLPGALALGLYTGGILGRLVAEAWEDVDLRPRDALRSIGVDRRVAAVAAVAPPSVHQLVAYTLYRFEICVRDTAVVGVVGAAGLGRLLAENLAVFRFPVVTTLLAASFAVSLASEVGGRWLRRAMRA